MQGVRSTHQPKTYQQKGLVIKHFGVRNGASMEFPASRRVQARGKWCNICKAGLSTPLRCSSRPNQALQIPLRQSSWPSQQQRQGKRQQCITRSNLQEEVLLPLGLDFLTFLAATVLVIPIFKSRKASPVLGFLFTGLVLGQLGLFRNPEELEKLSELGVLFLLFEMGLELSLDRLKALAKYAFGLGTITMAATTAAFTIFALPVGKGIGTKILVDVFHASPKLAGIRSVDEAIVIAAALSLSSSAFVLQLLSEKGELATKFGSAVLGILLFQDIAIVPFLVLLPVVESPEMDGQSTMALVTSLGPTALKTLGGLGLLLLGGRFILRRIFELVAQARSDDTFFALCLLTVTGASLCTQKLGFSDTLGAFSAGVLLAETNYRTQVEADIRPFRGMLLGLFFVTTGASLDVNLLIHTWPIVFALLGGLLAVKVGIIGTAAQFFGLTKADAIRTGFTLAQGGEFAFVLLSLAKELKVLPDELNRLLIIVVVLSMALTPALADFGEKMAGKATEITDEKQEDTDYTPAPVDSRPVVICGFGELGQTVANMLESPLAPMPDTQKVPYIAFDLSVDRIKNARAAGFNVIYGNGSSHVIHAAGVSEPRAFVIVYTARARLVHSVSELHKAFPDVPIFCRALDAHHAAELNSSGATDIIDTNTEAGTALGSRLMKKFGAKPAALDVLTRALRTQVDRRFSQQSKESLDPKNGENPRDAVFRFNTTDVTLDEVSTPYLQTTTSIAESEKNEQKNENGHSNGKPRSQNGNGKSNLKLNGDEEKIQNSIYNSQDLQTDSIEHLGEKPIYQTMDIQTDDSEKKSERRK